MRSLILIACLCMTMPLIINAQQQKVVFGYDAAGNRISRTITVYKITEEDSTKNQVISPEAIENALLQKITVYPNPTDGMVNIESSLPLKNKGKYILAGATGTIIEQGDLTSSHTVLYLQNLGKGIYLLTVEAEGVKEQFKIIKQ